MINPAFLNFPQEATLLGSMVIGFGELELSFSHICGLALNQKYAVLDACHSIRSEAARLDVAHALAKGAFQTEGLEEEYDHTHSAMRYCLKVRNQYTHSQWADGGGGRLQITNGEDAFKGGPKPVKWKTVSLDLLTAQEAYFENTRMWLLYLEMTLNERTAKKPNVWTKPQKMHQPSLHSQPLKPARGRKGKASHA